MKNRFGTIILLVALLLVLSKPAAPEPKTPPIELDRDRIRNFGVILNIVSEEMIAVADSDDIEEHFVKRAERVFDDFAKETDFIGPDFITRPLARKAVRPVVSIVIRYVDKKGRELSEQEEIYCNE